MRWPALEDHGGTETLLGKGDGPNPVKPVHLKSILVQAEGPEVAEMSGLARLTRAYIDWGNAMQGQQGVGHVGVSEADDSPLLDGLYK